MASEQVLMLGDHAGVCVRASSVMSIGRSRSTRVSQNAGSATRALGSKQRSIFGGGSTRPISPCAAKRLEAAPTEKLKRLAVFTDLGRRR